MTPINKIDKNPRKLSNKIGITNPVYIGRTDLGTDVYSATANRGGSLVLPGQIFTIGTDEIPMKYTNNEDSASTTLTRLELDQLV